MPRVRRQHATELQKGDSLRRVRRRGSCEALDCFGICARVVRWLLMIWIDRLHRFTCLALGFRRCRSANGVARTAGSGGGAQGAGLVVVVAILSMEVVLLGGGSAPLII